MGDKKTIAEQQLEDLRVLHDLLASGEVSAKDFKEQKARIMRQGSGDSGGGVNHAGAGTGGPGRPGISMRQLNRRSGLPGHIKLLIVLGLLSTLAVTLYLTIDLSIFLDAYEDPAAEPAIPTPTVGSATAPPPAEPYPGIFSGQNRRPEDAAADGAGVSTNWLLDEEAAGAAEAPTAQPPQASPPQTPEPVNPGPRLDWPVRFEDYPLPPEHPFHTWCDATKLIKGGQGGALIGVTVGPKALSLDDSIYLDFCQQTQQALIGEYGARNGLESQKHITGMPMIIAGRPADRCVLIPPRSLGMNVVITTVQDGRCYAYWFEGPRALYRPFIGAVGQATYTE